MLVPTIRRVGMKAEAADSILRSIDDSPCVANNTTMVAESTTRTIATTTMMMTSVTYASSILCGVGVTPTSSSSSSSSSSSHDGRTLLLHSRRRRPRQSCLSSSSSYVQSRFSLLLPLLLVVLAALSSCRTTCLAFSTSSSSSSSSSYSSPTWSRRWMTPSNNIRVVDELSRVSRRGDRHRHRMMSAVTDVPPVTASDVARRRRDHVEVDPPPVPPPSTSTSRMSSFQQRMRGLVQRNNNNNNNNSNNNNNNNVINGHRGPPSSGIGNRAAGDGGGGDGHIPPSNLRTIRTLEEYRDALDGCGKDGRIVVVRFFATWCKACKAIQPSYYRLASLYPSITFLEVPVTTENANLHQGLEVPSLPYGHIYYPGAGLVEEMRISRRHFHELSRAVRWYNEGMCGVGDRPPPMTGTEE
ncbi:hypothetical protein ACHAXA_008714 [Cyclostephanos tholiformis]|uniref:Thioredoxin domain-containing protein n=1 Tax=Cyclostephanos tholiformis TaxID=382380 RepID=A0ABD3R8K3_9STRA